MRVARPPCPVNVPSPAFGCAQLHQLHAEQTGLIGLVAVPVRDHALGLAAEEEELDGLAEGVVHDAEEAHYPIRCQVPQPLDSKPLSELDTVTVWFRVNPPFTMMSLPPNPESRAQ